MIRGVTEWFRPGEYDRVERVLERMQQTGLDHLRTGICWADTQRGETDHWFRWLLPRLAKEVEVVPCLAFTPPGLGVEPRVSSAPRDLEDFAGFVDALIEEHGEHFNWVELWDKPNDARNWDRSVDPDWTRFGEMVAQAARAAHGHGKKVLLGGMSPVEPHWLDDMFRHGAMEHIDAVGIHGAPGTWGHAWHGWDEEVARVQEVLDRHGHDAEVWVTEAGYSTVRHDGLRQVQAWEDVMALDVPRVYWRAMDDVAEDEAAVAPGLDEREHHFGMWRADGTPKLLGRLLSEGRDPSCLDWAIEEAARPAGPGHVVITGGAGFIGVNLADRLLREGRQVLVFDDLSRAGSIDNLQWLREAHGTAVHVRIADVRDRFALREAVADASAVFHLAAQVAVTTSMDDPRTDFEVNAQGTFNVLEAVRQNAPQAFFLFASTNKVYGTTGPRLTQRGQRWEPKGPRRNGRQLSFATPYGCSKGAADQYVLDHARTLGMAATVFRMSCIYGPMQNGTADQGWVAHFLRMAQQGRPLTIYGDGLQVRDMLHVDDLVEAYMMAMRRPDAVVGRAWDIGGGPDHTSSLTELLDLMGRIGMPVPPLRHEPARPSDQEYYVSDIRPLQDAIGWSPTIPVEQGIERLWRSMQHHQPKEVTA